MKHTLQRLLPFLTLVVLFLGLAIATPHFLTAMNLTSVVRQTAVINIMALGMTLIIVSGGIDLSVGAILAISGYTGCSVMAAGHSIPLSIAAGVLTGLACGFLNGLLTTTLKINPFIVTLGALGIYRGITLMVSNGLPVQVPRAFSFLAEGTLLKLPTALWVLLACAAAVHVLLEHTRLGRYAFAIGSNPEAAFYAGIPVAFHTTAITLPDRKI